MRTRPGILLAVALATLASPGGAYAWRDPARSDVASAVAQASVTSGLPRAWIESVIAAESGGDRFAVSRAGARGLMQLMPHTWADLQARLRLGSDPFNVHDNVLAGAVYLREMFDRFGARGFLAAYNAGPARYSAAVAGRVPLPPETAAYVLRLAPSLALRVPITTSSHAPRLAPQSAGLFPLLEATSP